MGRPKEVCYFQDTMDFKPNPNFEKDWEWYQQAFSHYQGEAVVGEATPSYSDRTRSPKTAQRIHEFNPEMKIIYMVRDSLELQISGWKMQWAEGVDGSWPERVENQWAPKGFIYWLERQREVGQWDVCRYAFQLGSYRERFPEENLLVSFLEDWREHRQGEVQRILEFLKLDPTFWEPSKAENANRATDRRVERGWYRQLRSSSIVRRASGLLPERMRSRIAGKIGTVKASIPAPDLDATVVKEFVQFSKNDWMSSDPFRSKGGDIWL